MALPSSGRLPVKLLPFGRTGACFNRAMTDANRKDKQVLACPLQKGSTSWTSHQVRRKASFACTITSKLISLGAAVVQVGGTPANGDGLAPAATACGVVMWPPEENWAATTAGARSAAPEARGACCRGPAGRVYCGAVIPAGHRHRCWRRASQDAAKGGLLPHRRLPASPRWQLGAETLDAPWTHA